MTRDLTASTQLFSSYLHQDWTDEFASDAEAVQAMVESEPRETIDAAGREIHALLDSDIGESELADLMTDQVGCYFNPGSNGQGYREWLGGVLTQWEAAAV